MCLAPHPANAVYIVTKPKTIVAISGSKDSPQIWLSLATVSRAFINYIYLLIYSLTKLQTVQFISQDGE